MLDTPSLRVAFGVVALTMLALFYFVTYRSTRSAYSAWWCAALGLFVSGASLYLFNGTVNQVWANPLANVFVVTGAAAVWAGLGPYGRRARRGGRSRSYRRWWAFLGPGRSGDNIWAGGPFYLAAMWTLLGMTATELWRQQRAYSPGPTTDTATYWLALRAMTFRLWSRGGLLLLPLGGLHLGWMDRHAVRGLLRRSGHHADLHRAARDGVVQYVDAQQRAAERRPAGERRPRRPHRPAQPDGVPAAGDEEVRRCVGSTAPPS